MATNPSNITWFGQTGLNLEEKKKETEPNITWFRTNEQETSAETEGGAFEGLGSDILKAGVRGIIGLGEMTARIPRAFDVVGGEDRIRKLTDPVIKGARQLLDQDPALQYSEKNQNSIIRRAITGGIESAPQSALGLVSAALGPLAWVGILGVYGANQFSQHIDQAMKEGKTYEETVPYALASAFIEGGGETVADILGAKLLGIGGINKFIKGSSKNIKDLLTTTFGSYLKGVIKDIPIEAGTEVGQNVGEALMQKLQGIQAPGLKEAALESIGPAIVMTALFGTGSYGMNKIQEKQIKDTLENPQVDPAERLKAVGYVYEQLSKLDEKNQTTDAELWSNIANNAIKQGTPINLSTPFSEMKDSISKKDEADNFIITFKNALNNGELSIGAAETTKDKLPQYADDIDKVVNEYKARDPFGTNFKSQEVIKKISQEVDNNFDYIILPKFERLQADIETGLKRKGAVIPGAMPLLAEKQAMKSAETMEAGGAEELLRKRTEFEKSPEGLKALGAEYAVQNEKLKDIAGRILVGEEVDTSELTTDELRQLSYLTEKEEKAVILPKRESRLIQEITYVKAIRNANKKFDLIDRKTKANIFPGKEFNTPRQAKDYFEEVKAQEKVTPTIVAPVKEVAPEVKEEIKPYVNFIGYQEDPTGEPIPLYNVTGSDKIAEGSTVSRETLEKNGIEVPETPEPTIKEPWKSDTKLEPREYQEKYPEKTVHEDWDKANSPRYILEAAGDILREFQKKDFDIGYIGEKLDRINANMEAMSGKKHPDDSLSAALKHKPEKLNRLISQYESQPTATDNQEMAKNAILALMKGDFQKSRDLYSKIESSLETPEAPKAIAPVESKAVAGKAKAKEAISPPKQSILDKSKYKVVLDDFGGAKLSDLEKMSKQITMDINAVATSSPQKGITISPINAEAYAKHILDKYPKVNKQELIDKIYEEAIEHESKHIDDAFADRSWTKEQWKKRELQLTKESDKRIEDFSESVLKDYPELVKQTQEPYKYSAEDLELKPKETSHLVKIANKEGNKIYAYKVGEDGIYNHADIMIKHNMNPEKTITGFIDNKGKFTEGYREPTKVTLEAKAKEPIKTFTTSKGSKYSLFEDGTTIRNKALRKEHLGEEGIQPKSEKTWYVSEEDALKLSEVQTEDTIKTIAQLSNGRIGVKYLTGESKGKFESRTIVTPKNEPELGLMPVESFGEGHTIHFGNKITEIKDYPELQAKKGEPWQQNIYDIIDHSVFKEIVSESIQKDGQKVLDAIGNGDIATLETLINKYAQDQMRDQGGGGAGPGKVKQARRGAPAIWNASQRALEHLQAKQAEEPVKQRATEAGEEKGIPTPIPPPELAEATPKREESGWETGNLDRPFVFDPNSTENEGRFRLQSPDLFQKDTYFSRGSTTPGIRYLYAKKKDTGNTEIQTIRFDKKKVSEEKAADWWEKNKERIGEKISKPEKVELPVSKEVVGTVRLDKGGVKPFTSWKEITKGPKKGRIEVALSNGKKVIVQREQIRTWPGEEVAKSKTEKEAIQDFGEKIGGARKDYYAEFADKMKDAQNVDIAAEPLSKSWPEPDYEKLIENGIDPWIVSFVRSAREEIPTKPQKSWKLDRWVAQVKMLRDFSNDLFNGKITKKELTDRLEDKEFATIKNVIGARIDLYEAVGHSRSLKGLRISSGRYSMYEGIEYKPPKIIWSIEKSGKGGILGNWPRIMATGKTREEAIQTFKDKFADLEEPEKIKKVKFDLYSKRGEEGVWVGKKIGRNYIDLEHFENAKIAREYLKTNQTILEDKLEQYKTIPNERRTANRERIGKDHRDGKDVTPEMFTEAFGFRGVEFGNWVNDRERQDNLNRAYDALIDLSLILNIPSKAISLNSELGLAFGARGIGGKNAPAAHYESSKIVINLTRKNGPGSLAHEWWHALDNYFSRRRGQKDQFISNTPQAIKEDKTRQLILDAYKNINDVIAKTKLQERSNELDKRRTNAYWGTGIEMTARAFENYVIEKLAQTDSINDYLANIVISQNYGMDMLISLLDGKTVQDIYPYLLDAEIEKVAEAYDNLFNTIKTETTEEGDIALYSLEALTPAQLERIVSIEYTDVKKAFPGSKVYPVRINFKDAKGGYAYLVTLPSGIQVVIDPTRDKIVFDPDKVSRDYKISKERLEQLVKANQWGAAAKYRGIGEYGLIEMLATSGPSTLSHEKFHALFDLALDKRDRINILKRYGTEEKAADAFRRREGFTRSFWDKIKAWIEKARNVLFGDVFKPVFEALEGEQVRREGEAATEGQTAYMMAGKKAKGDRPFIEDKYGKKIVYDDGEYIIAVNDENDARYISLWNNDEKVGYFSLFPITKNGEKYLKVSNIEIDKKHRGKGFGNKLYQVVSRYAKEGTKGIYSYLPDRVNKKEISSIFKKMKGRIVDGDHGYIDFENNNNIQYNPVLPEDERISYSMEKPPDYEAEAQAWINKVINKVEKKEKVMGVHRGARSVEAETIARELVDKEGFGDDIAKYEKEIGMMKRDYEAALDIVDNDFDSAMQMIKGEKELPQGIKNGPLLKAVENRALENGDLDLIYELGTSHNVYTKAMETARELKSYDYPISDNPIDAIRDIQKVREETIKKTTGKKPTAKQAEEIARLNKELESTRKALDEYTAREGEKKSKTAIDELIKTKISQPKGPATEITVESLTDKITASLDEGKDLSEISNYVQELAKYFVSTGIKERDALIEAVHNVLINIIPDTTIRETMDAISGYGKYKLLDKDEVLAQLRDLKGQMQQIAKLEDLQKTGVASKTGIERRTPSDEERRLIKLVEEAKKKYGIETVDKEKQLKSALDAIKTRLTNQIADLESQIESRQKIIKEKTRVTYDAEATRLKAKRDALKVEFDAIFGKTQKTEEQRINMALNAVRKSLAEYTRKIAEKDLTPMNKRSNLHSDELDRLRIEREGLRDQLLKLRDLANPKKTPEQIALQTLKTRMKNETLKLSNKLNVLDFVKKEKRVIELDPEGKKLKVAHGQAKENYNAAVKAVGIVTKEEAANIVRLSQITAEARTSMEQGGDRFIYGAAKRTYENYVNDLKGENLPLKTLLKNRWEEAKTTWKENKVKTFTDLIKDTIVTISDNSISFVASIDNSFLGRQGLNTLMTRPTAWVPIVKSSFSDIYKTLISKQGGQAVKDATWANVYSLPNFLNGSYGIAKLIPKTEEQFPAILSERIPVIGRMFKASENAFVNSAIWIRLKTFDILQKIAQDQGVDTSDKVWIQDTGKLINAITARGDLGRLGEGGVIRLILWAPKMLKGNIDVLTAHTGGAGLSTPFARKQAGMNLFKITGTTVAIVVIANALGHTFGGDDKDKDIVEINPLSSDFLKIKVGNTRYDIMGGKGSIVTLAARAITFSSKSSATGKTTKLNTGKYGAKTLFDVGIDFLVNKITPLARQVIDISRGRNFEGNKPTIRSVAYDLTTPIGIQNFVKNFYGEDKDGSAAAVVGSMADMVGINANTYNTENTRQRRTRERRTTRD